MHQGKNTLLLLTFLLQLVLVVLRRNALLDVLVWVILSIFVCFTRPGCAATGGARLHWRRVSVDAVLVLLVGKNLRWRALWIVLECRGWVPRVLCF